LLGRAYSDFTVCIWKLARIFLCRAAAWQTILMKTGALLARLVCGAILVFAFGVAVYRAKVQPIAHDEALTYEWFLD
jgi:hypothetical protein